MKSKISACIAAIMAVAALAVSARLGAQSNPAAQPTHYRVIDLGTLKGSYSLGFGINNAGEVAGQSATPAQTDPTAGTAFTSPRSGQITRRFRLALSADPVAM